MADTLESLVQWGIDNQHLKGTPEFEAKTQQYKQLRDAPSLTATPPPAPAAPPDPYSLYNTTARVGTGAATGFPDLGIALLNAETRAGYGGPGATEMGYLGPKALSAVGALPLPPDASVARQLLEAGGSAILGGGAPAILRAVNAAPTIYRALSAALSKLGTTTVAPTVGGHYGGDVGEKVATAAGTDPQTGALFGSIVGGVGSSGMAEAGRLGVDARYRGMGRPDAPAVAQAARNEGVTLPASALGNDTIRIRENGYANRWGASNFTQNLRMQARDQVGAALDDVAGARGSFNPMPTTGDIGATLGDITRLSAAELQTRAAAPQEALMQRVGSGAPFDWQPILDTMRRLSQETDAITARPIDARVNAIESRFPRDPVTGDITSTVGTYNQAKDFRTGTRIAGEGMDPVPSRYAGAVEDATTGAMRDTAQNAGVPTPLFDRVMERYAMAMGEGGPHEQLTAIADRANTNAASGYNYLRLGEQDPQRLRMLEATGHPGLPSMWGDYLRLMGNQTINSPNQGAPGPRQFATRIEGITPEALDVIAGPQRGRVDDIATLARALNAPTRQGGLGQTMGPIAQGVPAALTAGEVGHSIGSATGIAGAPTAGRVLGYLSGPARRAVGGRVMQGPTAMRALEGLPYQSNYGMSDLIAAMNAAAAANTQGAPLPGPRVQQ